MIAVCGLNGVAQCVHAGLDRAAAHVGVRRRDFHGSDERPFVDRRPADLGRSGAQRQRLDPPEPKRPGAGSDLLAACGKLDFNRLGHADGGLIDRGERMEPLHRAAGRVVRHLLVDVERDLRGGDVDALAMVGELDRRGGHLNDGADEPFRQLAGHRDERHLLRGVGTVVHEDRGARRRFPAADLVDAEIAVAGDGCHDGQAVERDAVEAAAIDLPGEHRVLADGLGLAAHDAAACEHFSGPSLDVLAAAGAGAASSPADVARQASVVITMVPDTPDVELVLAGADGVLSALRSGTVVVDMSSISPIATRRLASMVAAKNGAMLDAPVSGGEIGAINAALSIMVGGDAAAFERVRPILACMGNAERIVHIGESGAGQICKICNQIAIGGALAGVSEAFALARKAGVDAARVRQALLGGFAASRVLEVHGERMLKGNYVPGFRTKLYQNDLRIANEAAAANGVAMPATEIVAQLVNALVAAGGAELDYSAIGTVLRRLSGENW